MGKIDTPIVPIAYRNRDLRPFGPLEVGVEIIPTGEVFWAETYAEALNAAEAAGYNI